jgi:hypothetical protein
MASVNPDRISNIMQQLSAFDREVGSLAQVNAEERGVRLAGLRALATSIQTSLIATGIGLDAREVNAVSRLVEGGSDLTTVQRVSDLFYETVSRIVSAEFSLPLETAIRAALLTGDLSAVRGIAAQIRGRSLEINLCRFAQGSYLLEYLFQEPLFDRKITPQLLEELLNLGVSPDKGNKNPPLVNLLLGYLQGSYSQQETIRLLSLLAQFKVDPNRPLPGSTQSLLFILQDTIYGWSLEETPGTIELDAHYMVTPQLFEPVIDLLNQENKDALLASFSEEREDLVKLFIDRGAHL